MNSLSFETLPVIPNLEKILQPDTRKQSCTVVFTDSETIFDSCKIVNDKVKLIKFKENIDHDFDSSNIRHLNLVCFLSPTSSQAAQQLITYFQEYCIAIKNTQESIQLKFIASLHCFKYVKQITKHHQPLIQHFTLKPVTKLTYRSLAITSQEAALEKAEFVCQFADSLILCRPYETEILRKRIGKCKVLKRNSNILAEPALHAHRGNMIIEQSSAFLNYKAFQQVIVISALESGDTLDVVQMFQSAYTFVDLQCPAKEVAINLDQSQNSMLKSAAKPEGALVYEKFVSLSHSTFTRDNYVIEQPPIVSWSPKCYQLQFLLTTSWSAFKLHPGLVEFLQRTFPHVSKSQHKALRTALSQQVTVCPPGQGLRTAQIIVGMEYLVRGLSVNVFGDEELFDILQRFMNENGLESGHLTKCSYQECGDLYVGRVAGAARMRWAGCGIVLDE